MMLAVHEDANGAIKRFCPRYGDPGPRDPSPSSRPGGEAHVVRAEHSGFVTLVDVKNLVVGACEQDVVVEVLHLPGD